jgi:TRAP-type C4-dicarboxylate transport system substrate-binding protein
VLPQLVPISSMWGLGFAWANDDAVHKALDGELGKFLRGAVPARRPYGHGHDLELGVPADHQRRETDQHTDDLKGLKMRVPVSPLWTSLFKSLGSSPTSISFAETYPSLQTKVVDGQE